MRRTHRRARKERVALVPVISSTMAACLHGDPPFVDCLPFSLSAHEWNETGTLFEREQMAAKLRMAETAQRVQKHRIGRFGGRDEDIAETGCVACLRAVADNGSMQSKHGHPKAPLLPQNGEQGFSCCCQHELPKADQEAI